MALIGNVSKEVVMINKIEMKKIITILLSSFLYFNSFAQVSIGKEVVNGASAILDFKGNTLTENPLDQETSNTNGLILPALDSEPAIPAVFPTSNNPNNGTFIFDLNTQKVKMYENGAWIGLTDGDSDISSVVRNPSDEMTDVGVIIGSDTTNAKGVLVLESDNRALILPQIKNPHLTVVGAYPGMICYDTVSNSLAVYDGSFWSYWK